MTLMMKVMMTDMNRGLRMVKMAITTDMGMMIQMNIMIIMTPNIKKDMRKDMRKDIEKVKENTKSK